MVSSDPVGVTGFTTCGGDALVREVDPSASVPVGVANGGVGRWLPFVAGGVVSTVGAGVMSEAELTMGSGLAAVCVELL